MVVSARQRQQSSTKHEALPLLLLFQPPDAGVVAAAMALEIVVKYPNATILKADADVAEPAGHI